MIDRIGKYLTAVLTDAPIRARKTKTWQILGNSGDYLGTVAWYGMWRQYTFDPADAATFNRDCLIDIANFLRKVNDAHRAQRGGGP